MNSRQRDVNLLRVLVIIHRNRSMITAAKVLALSQLTTSKALARPRAFIADYLFARTPSRLKATRLCE